MDLDEHVTHALVVAFVDRRPNVFAASLNALWAHLCRRPSDEQIRAT